VKETVEKLKGKIQVLSELGKGTSFSIVLPAVSDESAEAQMKLGI
jgi:chemotaxis protein histidine kinase CheA